MPKRSRIFSYARVKGASSIRRSFQAMTIQPPGLRMRTNSRRAEAGSNQWEDFPAGTKSTLASAGVGASAEPSLLGEPSEEGGEFSPALRIYLLGSMT